MCLHIVLLITYHIAIGRNGFLSLVAVLIAVGQLPGTLSAQRPFLGRGLRVGLLILVGSVKILPQGQKFLASFEVRIGSATTAEHNEHPYHRIFAHQY